MVVSYCATDVRHVVRNFSTAAHLGAKGTRTSPCSDFWMCCFGNVLALFFFCSTSVALHHARNGENGILGIEAVHQRFENVHAKPLGSVGKRFDLRVDKFPVLRIRMRRVFVLWALYFDDERLERNRLEGAGVVSYRDLLRACIEYPANFSIPNLRPKAL